MSENFENKIVPFDQEEINRLVLKDWENCIKYLDQYFFISSSSTYLYRDINPDGITTCEGKFSKHISDRCFPWI